MPLSHRIVQAPILFQLIFYILLLFQANLLVISTTSLAKKSACNSCFDAEILQTLQTTLNLA